MDDDPRLHQERLLQVRSIVYRAVNPIIIMEFLLIVNRFVTKLPNGSIRWRIWFEQWRLVARYVAIREMLMFHVGFEPKYHAASNSMVYTYAECLLDDQSGVMETPRVRSSSILADANDNQAKKTSFIARYQVRSSSLSP